MPTINPMAAAFFCIQAATNQLTSLIFLRFAHNFNINVYVTSGLTKIKELVYHYMEGLSIIQESIITARALAKNQYFDLINHPPKQNQQL